MLTHCLREIAIRLHERRGDEFAKELWEGVLQADVEGRIREAFAAVAAAAPEFNIDLPPYENYVFSSARGIDELIATIRATL